MMKKLHILCNFKHTNIQGPVEKKGKAICRLGFPLPPLPQTRLLYPLEEDVDQFKKKYLELQRAMNENKDNDV